MKSKQALWMAGGLIAMALAWYSIETGPALVQAADLKLLPGTAALSGTVEAPKPFKAAQVYVMNTDKNILYMVYTSGGRYRAVNMFPGNYEVRVQKRGFASDVKKVSLKVGENATLDFSLREASTAPIGPGGFMGPAATAQEETRLVAYDELIPPGPERALFEKTCVYCHRPNFFGRQQKTAEQWNVAVNLMINRESQQGAQIPPGSLSDQDQQKIVAYLAKNFGPSSPRRALKIDAEMPLDEQVLANAMYIEYYLPLDPTLDAKNTQRRGQDPNFDKDGNVWYTDRSIPNRVGKLDPRTGAIKDFVLPNPQSDPHGLVVDAEGDVFWAETSGLHLGRLKPKTGEMVRYSMDPKGEIPGGQGHTPIVDSKQNVWFTVIIGNKLGKWDRKTEKVTLWEPPTYNSFPYGIVRDKNDNIYMAEFHGCKVAKFDPVTEKFTEYPALTQRTNSCLMRRLGIDSKGTIWYALFSHGKLGKLDPATGKVVEYDVPMPNSEPYDPWPDAQGNVWIGDGGQGGTLLKFDPRTEKFTYYPTPQITDQPKLEITREGAIWYNPRSSRKAAVGVLYPDVTKMTTLAAYY